MTNTTRKTKGTAVAESRWRERIIDKIESRPKSAGAKSAGGDRFHVRLGEEYLHLLRRAARNRGISLAGYIRRAVAVQIAADLGMSPIDVISTSSYPAAYGEKIPPYPYCPWAADAEGNQHHVPRDQMVLLPDDGKGYGRWPW